MKWWDVFAVKLLSYQRFNRWRRRLLWYSDIDCSDIKTRNIPRDQSSTDLKPLWSFVYCMFSFFYQLSWSDFFMVIDSPLSYTRVCESHSIANKRDKHTVNKVKDTFDWCYTLWGFSIHMFWFGFDSSCQPIVFTFPWFHWLRRGSGWLGCRLSASRKAAEWVYLLLVERKDLIKWWDGY